MEERGGGGPPQNSFSSNEHQEMAQESAVVHRDQAEPNGEDRHSKNPAESRGFEFSSNRNGDGGG